MTRRNSLFAGMLVAVFFVTGFAFAPAATAPTATETATYALDKSHSNVGFKVRHLGITNVNGSFRDFEGTVEVDPNDLSTLKVNTTIQVASIDTGIERRDGHLRSADFFEAETYGTITFTSKRVQKIDGTMFELVGDLTMKDVTKEVVLRGEMLGTAKMGESERISFEAETRVDRFDYNLKWDRMTEAGGLVVSREVRITLDIQAIKQ